MCSHNQKVCVDHTFIALMNEVQAQFKEVPLRGSAIALFLIGVITSAISNPSTSIVAVVWTVSIPVLASVLVYNLILKSSLKTSILLVVWGIISIAMSLLLSYGWQSANSHFDQQTFLGIVHLNVQTARLVNGGLDFIFTTSTLTAHYAVVALLIKRYEYKSVYALLLFAPLTVFLSNIAFIFIR